MTWGVPLWPTLKHQSDCMTTNSLIIAYLFANEINGLILGKLKGVGLGGFTYITRHDVILAGLGWGGCPLFPPEVSPEVSTVGLSQAPLAHMWLYLEA